MEAASGSLGDMAYTDHRSIALHEQIPNPNAQEFFLGRRLSRALGRLKDNFDKRSNKYGSLTTIDVS